MVQHSYHNNPCFDKDCHMERHQRHNDLLDQPQREYVRQQQWQYHGFQPPKVMQGRKYRNVKEYFDANRNTHSVQKPAVPKVQGNVHFRKSLSPASNYRSPAVISESDKLGWLRSELIKRTRIALKEHHVLGEGSFGKVLLIPAINSRTHRFSAVKYQTTRPNASDYRDQSVRQELEVQLKLTKAQFKEGVSIICPVLLVAMDQVEDSSSSVMNEWFVEMPPGRGVRVLSFAIMCLRHCLGPVSNC